VVTNNARLMEEVAKMVANSKKNMGPDIMTAPFALQKIVP
jgi:hypothetical protein